MNNLWQALISPLGVPLIIAFLLSFGITNFESVFGLYAANQYGYSPQQVGGVLTVVGAFSALIQGALTGPLTRRLGEVTVIRASLFASAIGFGLLTQPNNFPQVLLTVCFFVVSNAMLNPAVSALISKRTTRGQGFTMGLNNAFLSPGRISGPLWAGVVFDLNINFPYLTGATITVIGFCLSLAMLKEDEPRVETADLIG